MMRRLLPLLLCLMLLSGCRQDPLSPTVPFEPAQVPAPAVAGLPEGRQEATLWFRFGTEPFLAPETRLIEFPRQEGFALALLQALIEGPGAASTELRGLFPQGTKVISVTQSGRIMFVTLSKQIMNGYPDEPASWRDQPAWAAEVPLRRELAMQAIVAVLTENCPVDQAVILVDEGGIITDSLRLRRSYFTLDGDKSLADPLFREEDLLLTPARTAEVILETLQTSDYTRLYHFLSAADPESGAARPQEADFLAQMARLPRLVRFELEGGSILGDTALFTVSGAYWQEGIETPFHGLTLRLVREKGLWRIGLTELTGREAQP